MNNFLILHPNVLLYIFMHNIPCFEPNSILANMCLNSLSMTVCQHICYFFYLLIKTFFFQMLSSQLVLKSTRTLVNSYLFLVNSHLIFGQLVPTRINLYLFWSTRTCFWSTRTFYKKTCRCPMDIRTDGRTYGIIYVRTYGWTDRHTDIQAVRLRNSVGRTCVWNYVRTYLRTGRQTGRLSR